MPNKAESEKVIVNIVGGSTFGRYAKISSEKTYNMYVSDEWLISFAGWKKQIDLLPNGKGRGLFHSIRGGFLIAIVNSNVYRIDTDLNATLLGSIASASGEVYMDENQSNQICIVDGVNAYIYNWTLPPIIQVQDLSANPGLIPGYVCYHNQFFLFGNKNPTSTGGLWYIYVYMDDTHIKFYQQQALQTKPDYALAIRRIPAQGNNILVLGSSVCEIWTQIAGTQAAYRRNESINVDYGCLNVTTISSCDEYTAWLGVNESNAPVIMVYNQQGIEQISTDGINYVLNNLVAPQQSTAAFYKQDGHLFYQLTFFNEQDNLTLVYDFTTKKFFHLTDSESNYHPAIDVIYFNQTSFFLSINNAALYEMSSNYGAYDENTPYENNPDLVGEIPRIRICKAIRDADANHFVAKMLFMMIEQGYDDGYVGLDDNNTSLHYVPRVDLCLSADSGITYGSTVARYMQPLGVRQNKMTWQKMGLYNDLTLKFKFWGFSHFCVNNAYLLAG